MSINTYGRSGTFVYSPDISAAIDSINGVIDISDDIIDFTLDRQINAVSTFTCTLNNPNRKYNFDKSHSIRTMDRIVVMLKRTTYVQCFTGYITYAPIETLVPTPITINATCTLRILQATYWDDTLIQYQSLLLNVMDSVASSTNQTLNDGGVAQAIVNVLTQVCGWRASAIHIQGIPIAFLNFAATAYSQLISSQHGLDQNVIKELSQILSQYAITSGQSVQQGGGTYKSTTTLTNDTAPPGCDVIASEAVSFITNPIAGAQANYPGPNFLNPVDISQIGEDEHYCSMPFSYPQMTDQTAIQAAKQWISFNRVKNSYDGRLVQLSNLRTNKAIVLRATSIVQKPGAQQNGQAVYDPTISTLQCHPNVISYLNGGDPGTASNPGYSYISFSWADQTKVTAGQKIDLSTTSAASTFGGNQSTAPDVLKLTSVVNDVIDKMRQYVGTTPYVYGGSSPSQGGFDCSGLVQYAWSTVGVSLPRTTTAQFGTPGANQQTLGLYIPPTEMPQAGDALYFDIKSETNPPNHVQTLTSDFVNGKATMLGADTANAALKDQIYEGPITWQGLINGDYGGTYMGARRPVSLWDGNGKNLPALAANSSGAGAVGVAGTTSTSSSLNPNNPQQRSLLNLTNSYNNLFQMPQYDPRASVIVATPRAFILDNPVMQDLTQIIGAGLRCYQSAPNGDFIAWFPDYYGIYGTDPVIDISPVEIIDFQIYHDDNQLATHVAVIGDTNGIGTQVSFADYITTNGIVSVQDASTMALLFGSYLGQTNSSTNTKNTITNSINSQFHGLIPSQSEPSNQAPLNNLFSIADFLNRYGIRPYVDEQNMIHSHAIEYLYALQTFMLQWVNQFVSNVQFTFMPELYPGMRVALQMDNEDGGTNKYEFYCMSVTHQGSRSGGFTTQAQLTAPIKDGVIMHYGIS